MTVPAICLPEGALEDAGAAIEDFCWLMSSAITQEEYWSPDAGDAVLSVYHALLYQAEVKNGGHVQFLSNCDNRPEMYAAARSGLVLAGADLYAEMVGELIDWARENPEAVDAIDWRKPETLRPPVLNRLDDLFFAADGERSISAFAHAWLSSLPGLEICSRKDFEETVFRYQAANKD